LVGRPDYVLRGNVLEADDILGGDVVEPNGESVEIRGVLETEKSCGKRGVRGQEYLVLGRLPSGVEGGKRGEFALPL
jgi:hypothetical protein